MSVSSRGTRIATPNGTEGQTRCGEQDLQKARRPHRAQLLPRRRHEPAESQLGWGDAVVEVVGERGAAPDHWNGDGDERDARQPEDRTARPNGVHVFRQRRRLPRCQCRWECQAVHVRRGGRSGSQRGQPHLRAPHPVTDRSGATTPSDAGVDERHGAPTDGRQIPACDRAAIVTEHFQPLSVEHAVPCGPAEMASPIDRDAVPARDDADFGEHEPPVPRDA